MMHLFVWVTMITCCYCSAVSNSQNQGCRLPPPPLPNGRVKVRRSGHTLVFKCFPGFSLFNGNIFSRNNIAVCSSGEWVPEIRAKCIRWGCRTVIPPDNGRMYTLYRKALVLFSCDPGHVLHGPSIMTCNGSVWNGTSPPTCVQPPRPPQTSCRFDDDMCGWESLEQTPLRWIRQKLPFPDNTPGTGPKSNLDGYFVFLESSGTSPNMLAALFSPVFAPRLSRNGCWTISVYLRGATMGELRLLQLMEGEIDTKPIEEAGHLLLSLRGDHGSDWHRVKVPLVNTEHPFQLALVGMVGASYLSDMAADNFNLTANTSCLLSRPPISSTSQRTPISCYGRCFAAPVETMHEFPEGSCSCSAPQCQDQASDDCCADFTEECSDSRWSFMRALGLSWLHVGLGVACVTLLLVTTVVVIALRLTRRDRVCPQPRERLDGDGDEDYRFMVRPEDDLLDEGEEEFDFRLATPETVHDPLPPKPQVTSI